MEEKFEKIAKAVFRSWQDVQNQEPAAHPEEETLVCFLEGTLPAPEKEGLVSHLLSCPRCCQAFALQVKLQGEKEVRVPPELLKKLKHKGLLAESLEVVLRAKERMLELVATTADILVGQEVVPAPVLRTRKIKGFKDEITILKDFRSFRVEIRVRNQGNGEFSAEVAVKEKKTSRIIKDVRITLIKEEVELESYLASSGSVIFEHLLLGKYAVHLTTLDDKRAYVILDIRA